LGEAATGASLITRIDGWLKPSWRVVALFVALSLLINWPYLFGGFQADDIIFLNMLHQDPLPFSRWRGVWSQFELPCFDNLWWRDPGAGGAFFRPVPSLVIEGSVRLFGEHAFPLHLLSLMLHGGVAASLAVLLRRLWPTAMVGLLAGLLFICCEDHSMGVGWIATITDMLCVQFILLSLLAHQVWLQRRRKTALMASLLWMALALGSKESAATAPLALIVLALFAPRGRFDDDLSYRRWRSVLSAFFRGWKAWAPMLALLIVYVGLYKALRLGFMSNLMYIDPFGQTELFLSKLVVHLPVLWLGSLTPIWVGLSMFEPVLLLPFALLGAVSFAWLLWALWPFRRRGGVLWALALYMLVLLPQAGVDPSERAQYLPMVFASMLLALLITTTGPLARRLAVEHGPSPRASRAFGWWSLCALLLGGLLTSTACPFMFVESLQTAEKQALTARGLIEQRQPEQVLLLNTSSMMVTLYVGDVLSYHLGRPVDVRTLSSGHGLWSLERTAERSFVLRTDRPGWLSHPFARLVRNEPRLKVGRVYDNDAFTATVLRLTADGSDVRDVRFDIKASLDDPRFLFLQWTGTKFDALDLSTLAVGERVKLFDNSDVWAAIQ